LQGTKGHPDQLGDLLSAFSSLDQIPNLPDSLRRKLCLPPTSRDLRGKLRHLSHFLPSVHFFCPHICAIVPTPAAH
jgi:hypothetical protein